jgi:1-aminocyclopropane-1-carboxylate deaminase/D-cysteine desulfhydrase-like pyridoxal-dependent ACC family enzyme
MKSNSVNSIALAAAFAGLLCGTTTRSNAQTIDRNGATAATASSNAGVLLVAQDQTPTPPKHSCKGKNDCKGQGGGKTAGKNSCKGQGDCATDGSTPPPATKVA